MGYYKEEGGAAFPCVFQDADGVSVFQEGMSLRDWYAGLAMAVIIVNPEVQRSVSDAAVATNAFRKADAMLAQRLK